MAAHKEIIAKLPESFDKAQEAGDLFFFPSTVHTHAEHGVDVSSRFVPACTPSPILCTSPVARAPQFEIRLCPALENKPKLPTPHFAADAPSPPPPEETRHDPFAPPYNPRLLLGEVRDAFEGHEYVILVSARADLCARALSGRVR